MSKPKKSSYLAGVETATSALRGVFDATPLQYNAYLSDRYGAQIYLKREDLGPVRSYKLRGAFNFFRKAMLADPDNSKFCLFLGWQSCARVCVCLPEIWR